MVEAGYKLKKSSTDEFKFEAGDLKISAHIFTSIKSVNLGKCKTDAGEECVILVPSSESLEPFVQFYRDQADAVEAAKIQIWIANMEKGTIDPFIGFTTDMDIYKQFKNPRLAQMVRSHWKR